MNDKPPIYAYDPLTGLHTDLNEQKPVKYGVQHVVTSDHIDRAGEEVITREVKRVMMHQLADMLAERNWDAVEREHDDHRLLSERFRLEVYVLTKDQWREMCTRLRRIEHENRMLKQARTEG